MLLTINARLQWVLNLLIVSLSLVAAVAMVLLVFWFERSLFYNHLHSDLLDQVRVHASQQQPLVQPMTDTTYYKLPVSQQTLLPEPFRGYPEGGHEVLLADGAYNLFVHYQPGWVHVLVQDQSEFERYELRVFGGATLAVLMLWSLGFWLSRRLSRQILQPVSRLAIEVERLRHQPGTRLQGDYPDDETGLLARTFEDYARQLYQLLQREQQFSANASHELRTPMMVIRGALDMLRETGSGTAAEVRQLNRMEAALNDMQQQVELFLQLSRAPEAAAAYDTPEPLAQLAARCMACWQPQADARGLSLTLITGTDDGPMVPATLTGAVINNLLRNALNHTAEGHIELCLGPDWLEVRDSGEGIASEVLARVRERGVSGGSGFGLGLAIVARICEQQGWRLSLTANQPAGTRVRIGF
ncbi:HAMP domain-containing sensor histidine kinase [Oceanimonas sp. CAM02]|uniref:sensor histidine kinase n=1 Tax=Oceanimonas sp. CAM02 TaxID=3080336 RepID=UPI002935957D|nr:HAMP domain-containing sensor histidine kinase [Oceanimonas sp. CAM02]MDV2857534.1 HAMP domain-containing sensor histidine kinase [Oceanimonas sp. CAM02]